MKTQSSYLNRIDPFGPPDFVAYKINVEINSRTHRKMNNNLEQHTHDIGNFLSS